MRLRKSLALAREYFVQWDGYSVIREIDKLLSNTDIFIAGGAVRNSIIAPTVRPRDFDLIIDTNCEEEILSFLKVKGRLTTGQYGSPRWYPPTGNVYCDIIFISYFTTGLTPCRNAIDVLTQFDFTGNAIAIPVSRSGLLDPLQGSVDLSNRILRGVRFDYPDYKIRTDTSLTSNAVLWFRFLHYSNQYRLTIEYKTKEWLLANMHFLEQKNIFFEEYYHVDDRVIEKCLTNKDRS